MGDAGKLELIDGLGQLDHRRLGEPGCDHHVAFQPICGAEDSDWARIELCAADRFGCAGLFGLLPAGDRRDAAQRAALKRQGDASEPNSHPELDPVHAGHWRDCAAVYSARARQPAPRLRKRIRHAWPGGLASADLAISDRNARLSVPRELRLDSFHRRALFAGNRRYQLPFDHADHDSGRDFDSLVVERDSEPQEGILHSVSAAADGHAGRLYAAIKFFLYTLAGSVLMLLAILALYYRAHELAGAGAAYTFDIPTLLGAVPQFSTTLQRILFWGFFFAFAIKVPMFPFHTWLPDAHTEAPTAGSVILAGVLLKMGTYGFIRFSLPLLPTDAVARQHIINILMVLSIVGIIYGALVCMMQKDMKKLITYSSVSHLGFCTLGIFALNPHGVSGSVIQQINHGISTGALFLIVGVLYERRHTRLISEYGGLSTPMPNFAAIY